jgi:hypothetical protein
MNEGKPVDLFVIEPTAIDGVHVPKGTILEGVDPETSLILAGAGKVRLATEADAAAATKAAKK